MNFVLFSELKNPEEEFLVIEVWYVSFLPHHPLLFTLSSLSLLSLFSFLYSPSLILHTLSSLLSLSPLSFPPSFPFFSPSLVKLFFFSLYIQCTMSSFPSLSVPLSSLSKCSFFDSSLGILMKKTIRRK